MLRNAIRRWRRQRGMSEEQKLLDVLEEFGARGFNVVRYSETPPVRVPLGARARPATPPDTQPEPPTCEHGRTVAHQMPDTYALVICHGPSLDPQGQAAQPDTEDRPDHERHCPATNGACAEGCAPGGCAVEKRRNAADTP